ncbi:MAG: hypothetical protein ACXWR1_02375 [Bdellovibrionota bacterium]
MKTKKLPLLTLAALALAITLSSCGKTNRAASASTDTSVSTAPVNSCCSTVTFTNTSTSTSTNTSVSLQAPLSFEFTLLGSQNAITPAFTTDNVLKVKFTPGATQGNSFHSASELAITLTTNGTSVTPKYTSNNYTYGQVGETSNVIDLSGYIQPGVKVQIAITNPMSDFYCTYAPNPFYYFDGTQYVPTNPLYNVYPGCRKAVFSTHQWSGTLVVQTSSTTAI